MWITVSTFHESHEIVASFEVGIDKFGDLEPVYQEGNRTEKELKDMGIFDMLADRACDDFSLVEHRNDVLADEADRKYDASKDK